ncbi:MAG: arsenate reductase ArsC [Acidobacteriota bacterium]
MSGKRRVLILCTGNSCRSQMAEGWVRHDLGDFVEVFSAGTKPTAVHPLAVAVMAEAGVDLCGHRSKSVSEYWEQSFDLVATVCDAAHEACPAFPGAARQVHASIPDPAPFGTQGEAALTEFRRVRDLIREKVVPLVRRELAL